MTLRIKGKENNVIFLTPLKASSVKAIANIFFIFYFKPPNSTL